MARKKLSRNAPCPCGSGKKYKHCCWGKGFDWVEDEDHHVVRSTPMSAEIREMLQEQRQRFIEKYGREPGPEDLVFFDAPPVEHLEHQMVEAMKAADLDPAYIYAFEKTGLLVTEQNQHLIPEKDLAEWHAALAEYEAQHPRPQGPPPYPVGTVAFYGPDDRTTTKIAAGVIYQEDAAPIVKRWVATDVTTNPRVQKELQEFFAQHGVKSVAVSDGNMGCPHEEGEDFPVGGDCPFCPFWKGKQGSKRRD